MIIFVDHSDGKHPVKNVGGLFKDSVQLIGISVTVQEGECSHLDPLFPLFFLFPFCKDANLEGGKKPYGYESTFSLRNAIEF